MHAHIRRVLPNYLRRVSKNTHEHVIVMLYTCDIEEEEKGGRDEQDYGVCDRGIG
jgi:hypothetical protein